MAGIDSLVLQGGKSLLKDKASEFLNPSQIELARFAINPQSYLAEKGIAAVADLLGYGGAYKELKAGAKDEKDYYKETMRDAIASVLPGAVGDFVRATPKGIDAPAGTHWDPDTQSWKESKSPAVSSNPFSQQQFDAAYNPDSVFNVGSQNYVGPQNPQTLDSDVYHNNVQDLLSMLEAYKVEQPKTANEIFSGDITAKPLVMENNTPGGDVGSGTLDFGGTMDMSDSLGAYDQTPAEMNNVPSGGKTAFDELVAMYEMARGGQIREGGR